MVFQCSLGWLYCISEILKILVKLEKTFNFQIGNAILYIDKLIYSQIDCVYKQFVWILLSEAVFTRQYGNFETGPLAAYASHFLPVHLTPVHVNLPSAGGGAGLPHVACCYGGTELSRITLEQALLREQVQKKLIDEVVGLAVQLN